MELTVNLKLPNTAFMRGEGPRIVAEEMAACIDGALILVRGEVVPRTPANQSLLRGAWQTDLAEPAGEVMMGKLFNPLSYALPVETGTVPHFPPVAPLAFWAQRKLGISESESKSVGFLIARAISRRGTRGAWMLRDALAATHAQILARFETCRVRIIQRLEAS